MAKEDRVSSMDNDSFIEIEEELKEKDAEINELEEKLIQTERKLN